MGAITRLCIRYAVTAAFTTLIFSIPFAGIGCILAGIAGLFVGAVLMLPVVIFFGFIEEKLWRLPYSDEAVLSLIGLLIMIPSIFLSLVLIDESFTDIWIFAVVGLVGIVSVLFSRKSLIRKRTQFIFDYEDSTIEEPVPAYPKY